VIRIRRVHSSYRQDDVIRQVQEIFRRNFGAVAEYAEKIPTLLDEPFSQGYRTVLLVAERGLGQVLGFALVIVFPEIRSTYLDFIAVRQGTRGGGLGGALYEAVREFSLFVGARALYLEAMPDDPVVIRDVEERALNRSRLRFYERYGVRPVTGTAYETPIDEGPAPHLLFDGLGRTKPLGREEARRAVRHILERKYGHLLGPDYIRKVVASFSDDPVQLRPIRAGSGPDHAFAVSSQRLEQPIAVIASPKNNLHHVHDRGYVERPARVGALMEAIRRSGLFREVKFRHHGESALRAVHAADFVSYLKRVCAGLPARRPVYPYVFPIRRPERRPKELAVRAGYYCIDTFTPLYGEAYEAARGAVDVALTGAEELLRGTRIAYALCRPPGHHAERRVFGGFCYFNNAAVAAQWLSREGKVAVLDIDFHHGNGTQDIFYRRADVFTLSIHGHPNFAYPYFSGFADEKGEGGGRGFNMNIPLPDKTEEGRYLKALDAACDRIAAFRPVALVVSVGLDTMKNDPTGGFLLTPRSMERIGGRLASLNLPTLVVQEGGYNLTNLKQGAVAFFNGLATALRR